MAVSQFGDKIDVSKLNNGGIEFMVFVRWDLLAPVITILVMILLWCFYFTYKDE